MTVNLRCLLAVSALGLMVSACASTREARPPAGLSEYVTSVLNGFYDDIDDPTNRPPLLSQPPEGVVKAVDVNGDGVNDWIVEWPASSQFCGTGGCRVTVYLTHGQNLERIFDRQTLAPLDISTVDGEPRIESRFHHTSCAITREICRLAWGLDPAQRRLVARPSANGDRYSARNNENPIYGSWAGAD